MKFASYAVGIPAGLGAGWLLAGLGTALPGVAMLLAACFFGVVLSAFFMMIHIEQMSR